MARPHRVGERHGVQPDRPGAPDRQRHDGGRQRRPDPEGHGRGPRRGRGARRHDQPDGRPAVVASRTRSPASRARWAPRACSAARPRSRACRGTWRDLTESVNGMASNLTDQVRSIAEVTTAVANGDLSRQDHRRGARRGRRARRHAEHDGRPPALVRRRGHPRRPRGGHRGQARRPGRGRGRQRHVEGAHRVGERHGVQPDRPGAPDRAGDDRGRQRRPVPEGHRRGPRRGRGARRHHQPDGRPALVVRGRGHPRRPRGGHRGRPRRPGRRQGRLRHVARPHRVGERHGVEPDRPGALDRAGHDRGRQRRPVAEGHGRGPRRGRGARRHDQPDGRPALVVRGGGHPRRAARSAPRASSAARPRSRACPAPGAA